MLLERAAGFFQAQGYAVRVQPCIIGDSGAIHNPDLLLAREGERGRAVFVFEALDGPMPLEGRRAAAQDMACDAVFVVGEPSEEVTGWAQRHRLDLLTAGDLGVAVPSAPAGHAPAPVPEGNPASPSLPAPTPVFDTDEDILAVSPSRNRVPEKPLTAFLPPSEPAALLLPPAPAEDDGAVLLPSPPRPDAPKPRTRTGRGVIEFPDEVPEDGDAMLLPSRPVAAPPPPAPQAPAPMAEDLPGGTGAELLPSRPMALPAPGEAGRIAKHDPSIWNPTARLQQVKQAARAQGFETTAPRAEPYQSDWLNKLKR